jgi:hypothetical protein
MIIRILVRIVFCFLILTCLPISNVWAVKYSTWFSQNFFGTTEPLSVLFFGSGDRLFDYFKIFSHLVISAGVGLLWGGIDKSRSRTEKLAGLSQVMVRGILAYVFIGYGFSKLIEPLQFGEVGLYRLIEPFGKASPMGLLWTFMASSKNYTHFCGLMEVIAGILILLPRVYILGAGLSLVLAINIFLLNLFYDVPVKLFSSMLVVASLYLLIPLAPFVKRLLLMEEQQKLNISLQVFKTRRANIALQVFMILFGVYLVKPFVQRLMIAPIEKPKVANYGIWYIANVKPDQNFPWTHLIFEREGQIVAQLRDQSAVWLTIQNPASSDELTFDNFKNEWPGSFKIEESSADQMTLKGKLRNKPLELVLKLVPVAESPLMNRGFHWISDRPYNR